MTLGRRGPARAGTPASPPEASVVLVAHPGADLYGSDRMLLESVDGLVVSGHRVVVVRVFTKKTQKTPRREIELALKRAEEVT